MRNTYHRRHHHCHRRHRHSLIKTFADNVIWCCDRCYCQLVFPNRNTSNRKYLLKWHIIQHLHAPNSSILLHFSLLVLSVSRALSTKNIRFGSWRRKMCHQFGLCVCVRRKTCEPAIHIDEWMETRKGGAGSHTAEETENRAQFSSVSSPAESRIKFYSVTTSNEETIWSWHKRIHSFEWQQSEYKITISFLFFKRWIFLFVRKRCRFVPISFPSRSSVAGS